MQDTEAKQLRLQGYPWIYPNDHQVRSETPKKIMKCAHPRMISMVYRATDWLRYKKTMADGVEDEFEALWRHRAAETEDEVMLWLQEMLGCAWVLYSFSPNHGSGKWLYLKVTTIGGPAFDFHDYGRNCKLIRLANNSIIEKVLVRTGYENYSYVVPSFNF